MSDTRENGNLAVSSALALTDVQIVQTVQSLETNPAAVYLSRLAPSSAKVQREALETIAAILSGGRLTAAALPWADLRYQHTAALRSQLANRYAPSTANRYLSAIRGVLEEAWRLGLMTAEDSQRARDVANVRGNAAPAGRAFSSGELAALLASCEDGTRAGVRDAALLATLYAGGLRRAEAASLSLADYDPVDGVLRVLGKGRKHRVVYPVAAAPYLDAWLRERGSEPGALFPPLSRSGRLMPRHLSGDSVQGILARRADQAGLAHCTPHDFRRTFVGDLLDAGADIATVQKLAGHASPGTTSRYDRRGDATKKRAASLLRLPKQ